MKNAEFIPADSGVHGRLHLPLLFWCAPLLQVRMWMLLLVAGTSRQQGGAIPNLLYPNRDRFWFGSLPGMPTMLAFLLNGYRQHLPRAW